MIILNTERMCSVMDNGYYENGNNYNYDQNNGYGTGGGYGNYSGPGTGGSSNGNKNGKKKKNGNGSHWAKVVASALIFGLIAGTTMYAVDSAASAGSATATASADSSDTSVTSASSSSSDSSDTKSTSGSLTSNDGKDLSETTDTADSNGDGELTVAEVAQNAMPAMVTISTMSVEQMQSFFGGTQDYQVEGAGSGVILEINNDEVLIATNNHVINGADQVSVGFCDDSAYEANVKGSDSDNDLAVVAVKTSDLSESTLNQIKAITIGDSDQAALGDQVVVIGNALGYGESVTSGYVSALDRSLDLSDGTTTFTSSGLIQTDAAINSGNSGGALLNMKGELIGINEAKASSSSDNATVDNMGYAIPINKAQPILQELMSQETKEKYSDEERGYLGITITDVTSDYSQIYGIPEGVGVTSVASGSAADQAGLQKGDIITGIGGTDVSTAEELTNQLEYYKSGDQVEITYQRAGSDGNYTEQKATVTLESETDALGSQQSSANNNSDNGSANLYQQIIGSGSTSAY